MAKYGVVDQFYNQYLGRAADAGGSAHWDATIDQWFAQGMTGDQINARLAQEFQRSPEAQTRSAASGVVSGAQAQTPQTLSSALTPTYSTPSARNVSTDAKVWTGSGWQVVPTFSNLHTTNALKQQGYDDEKYYDTTWVGDGGTGDSAGGYTQQNTYDTNLYERFNEGSGTGDSYQDSPYWRKKNEAKNVYANTNSFAPTGDAATDRFWLQNYEGGISNQNNWEMHEGAQNNTDTYRAGRLKVSDGTSRDIKWHLRGDQWVPEVGTEHGWDTNAENRTRNIALASIVAAGVGGIAAGYGATGGAGAASTTGTAGTAATVGGTGLTQAELMAMAYGGVGDVAGGTAAASGMSGGIGAYGAGFGLPGGIVAGEAGGGIMGLSNMAGVGSGASAGMNAVDAYNAAQPYGPNNPQITDVTQGTNPGGESSWWDTIKDYGSNINRLIGGGQAGAGGAGGGLFGAGGLNLQSLINSGFLYDQFRDLDKSADRLEGQYGTQAGALQGQISRTSGLADSLIAKLNATPDQAAAIADMISKADERQGINDQERVGLYDNINEAGNKMDSVYSALGPAKMYGEQDIESLQQSIYGNRVGEVDRALKVASGQGFADSLRRGMADSSVAADSRDNIVRRFSDTYGKLAADSRGEANNQVTGYSNLQTNQRNAAIDQQAKAIAPELQARIATYKPSDIAVTARQQGVQSGQNNQNSLYTALTNANDQSIKAQQAQAKNAQELAATARGAAGEARSRLFGSLATGAGGGYINGSTGGGGTAGGGGGTNWGSTIGTVVDIARRIWG